MKETDVAWIAGLFEGEGCFSFDNERPRGIAIVMTDRDIIDRLQSLAGGTVYVCSPRKDKPHWKATYRWNLSSGESVALVQLILPYLGERRTKRTKFYLEKVKTRADRYSSRISVTDARNAEIKRLVSEDGLSYQELAEKYSLSREHINRIVLGRLDRKVRSNVT